MDCVYTAQASQNRFLNQRFLSAFHPIGTAKYIKIHSIQVYGNNIDVVFTIYWQGPITTDGYTKVAMHYDGDVQRWTSSQILATNGITNSEFNEAAFDFGYEIGSALGERRNSDKNDDQNR